MKWISPLAMIVFLLFNISLQAQSEGEKLFKSICSSCHTINKGKLIGPDLSGVYQKKNTEWLVKFIRSSQELVKSGDPDAIAIFNEFNKIPMPDNPLTDEQIHSIIEFIKISDQNAPAAVDKSKAALDTAAVSPDSTVAATAAAKDTTGIVFNAKTEQMGRSLFNGFTQFANGAVPCISCHNINDQSFLGGGKLAFDLTKSYTKLGTEGIRAILVNPPFPAMKSAIRNNLEADEINAIISLLKSVDERNINFSSQSHGGLSFFTLGFVCALFLLVHVYIFYDDRKIPEKSPEKTTYKK